MSAHGSKCICSVCTCGRHKLCKPVHLTAAKIDAHTEYGDHFLNFPIKVVRGRPNPQELSVGGEFYAGTETREKYTEHQLGPRYQIVKPAYIPNTAKLDSLTTQKENYTDWPIKSVPLRRKPGTKWVPTTTVFSGETTTKSDYTEMALPQKYVRKQQQYVKAADKMDGISTQVSDYQAWPVTAAPSRRKKAAPPTINKEDRDFLSTTNASYVGHAHNRFLAKPPPHLTTDQAARFEGASTAKTAYLPWELPPKFHHKKAVYVPSQGEFNPVTTYKGAYVPKTAGISLFELERYVHPATVYHANEAKFEGKSTNKTDFLNPGSTKRVADFAPRNQYHFKKDDRDFASTTQSSHSKKPLPKCAAADWVSIGLESDTGGHVHLKHAVEAVDK